MSYVCLVIGMILGFLSCMSIISFVLSRRSAGVLKIVTSEDNELLLELNKPLHYVMRQKHISLKVEKFDDF